MNIDQISELLRLLREINERLARIEGIVQPAAMTPRISEQALRLFAADFVTAREQE